MRGSDGARRGSALKELSAIQDGSVLICDGKVKSVGSTRRIENLKEARTALEIDVNGCVVMPGFIDPGLRTSSERAEFQRRGPKKTREIFDENLELMRSCLQHGTLTVEMKVDEPGKFPSAVPILRQLAKIGDSPVGMVRTWKVSRAPEFTDELDEFLATVDAIKRRKLAHFVEIGTNVAASEFGGSMLTALSLAGMPLKIDTRDGSAPAFADSLSELTPASVTHSTFMSEASARHCAASGQVAMFCPGSDIAETCGSGMRQVIDHGGAIALTSGYDARSARGYNMQIAIARAVALGGISVEEAITAATINAAHALGQSAQTGTIQQGKRADIAILAIPDYRELPRQFGINQVRQVLRDGQVVFNRGRWRIGAHANEARDGGMRTEPLRRTRSQAS